MAAAATKLLPAEALDVRPRLASVVVLHVHGFCLDLAATLRLQLAHFEGPCLQFRIGGDVALLPLEFAGRMPPHRSSLTTVGDPQYLRLGTRLRNYLVLGGLTLLAAAAVEPLSTEQYRLSILGPMLLVAAALSSIPVPVGERRDFGTLWTLPLDETPPPSPRAGVGFGAALGIVFALLSGASAIWGAIFGAAAGLLYGSAAPLARYRLGHGLLLSLATAGYWIGIYADSTDAMIGVVVGPIWGAIAALDWESDFFKRKQKRGSLGSSQ